MDQIKNSLSEIRAIIDNEEERVNELYNGLETQLDILERRISLIENILLTIIRSDGPIE
jgi:hypothetical protein